MKKRLAKIINNDTLLLVICSILFELIVYIFEEFISSNVYILLLVSLIIIFIILLINKNKDKKNPFYIIYTIGLLLRTLYILKTGVNTREHDVATIFNDGHLGYIFTIYNTHRLPLTNTYQFYHPPLWHIIGAIWLKINNIFKVDLSKSIEGLQILTTLFSSFIIIIVDKVCQKLEIKKRSRYLIDFVIAMHPTLMLFSGCINNDCLTTFLEFLIILVLINWNDNPNWKNIIYLAIITGLCVMTKTNGAIMAVPIMYIFIKKIIDNKKDFLGYIKKYFVFGLISLPIGLWHWVRNLLLFKDNKIPKPPMTLYTGNYSILERFIKFDYKNLFYDPKTVFSYNLPTHIIKTSLFGELMEVNKALKGALIVLNIEIILLSLILIIIYIIKNRKNIIINTLIITWITSMIAMNIFYYMYPYWCTMDFRYIVITLLPGVAIIGYTLDKIKNKQLRTLLEAILLLFSILCILLILILCIE